MRFNAKASVSLATCLVVSVVFNEEFQTGRVGCSLEEIFQLFLTFSTFLPTPRVSALHGFTL